MTYDEWLELCPDKRKFLMEYVDIRSDILNVITTYEKSVNPDKEDELVDMVLDDFYNQDWGDHNDFISYLIDRRLEE